MLIGQAKATYIVGSYNDLLLLLLFFNVDDLRSCATLLKQKGKIDMKTSGLYFFWSSKSLVTTFT